MPGPAPQENPPGDLGCRGSPDPAPGTTARSPDSGRPTVGGFGEVGRPAPSTRSKEIVLVIGFLAILVTPGIIQTVVELRRGETIQALTVFRRRPTAKNLREYERELEEASWVARQLRPWMQYAQFRFLQEAGDKALVGRDGWMFYKPGVRYLTERPAAPHPAPRRTIPRAAILDFRDQLAQRGIRLLVMIAPNKESIYPQMLSRWAGGANPARC